MTVKQLIEQLQRFPQDLEVILSSDPEGNSFDTIGLVEKAVYTNWSDIEIMHPDDLKDMTDEEKDGVMDCVIIWP